jgi:putative addiction module antidote protein, CC2985 family
MAITTMNISLPDSMRAFVDERLESDGYGTASEYIRDLIRADQKRHDDERLEELLLERLQSGVGRKFSVDDVITELAKRRSKKK